MPGLDGTGPLGLGPGTGWGRGYCGVPGRPRLGFGRGRRFGCWGSAWGWRPRWSVRAFGPGWFPETAPKEVLEQEKAYLQQELAAIEKRLAELQANES